jgi:putative peptidoglycan lipid II flippase
MPATNADRPAATGVARSARTISLAVMGSRLLGLVREQLLAALFGASREFDAFLTAFRIPNLLRDLFAEGALSAAFVTTFTRRLATGGDRPAWRLANLVLNALLVSLSVITLLGIIAAPWIVRAIAPGFAHVPGKIELTVLLTRIMFPFLLLVALAALAMGILNARQRFGVPASASMMFNVGSIVVGIGLGWWLDPAFGPRAMIGMSIGTLVGGAAQLVFQLPSLWRVGYRYEPLLDWRDPGLREVLRLVGPSVIGVAAVQINVFVNTWFASFYGDGAVTALNCAFRLMQFPIGVFGVAISMATLPTVSRQVAEADMERFRRTLSRSIRLAIFLCLPAACGLATLAEPIISVIYQHGQFSAEATARTAMALRMFAVGLAGYAAIKVIAPTFYALGDARTPMLVALGSIAVNAGLNHLFGDRLGMKTAGLALATSTVALTNFALLAGLMGRKLGGIEGRSLALAIAKVASAATLMSVAARGVHQWLDVNRYVDLAGAIAVAVLVFAGGCKLLRIAEYRDLLDALRPDAAAGNAPPD